jgi:hypothetical protein
MKISSLLTKTACKNLAVTVAPLACAMLFFPKTNHATHGETPEEVGSPKQ